VGVFAWQNLTRVGDVAAHQLRLGERNFLRRKGLLLGFGGAHVEKGAARLSFPCALSTGIFDLPIHRPRHVWKPA